MKERARGREREKERCVQFSTSLSFFHRRSLIPQRAFYWPCLLHADPTAVLDTAARTAFPATWPGSVRKPSNATKDSKGEKERETRRGRRTFYSTEFATRRWRASWWRRYDRHDDSDAAVRGSHREDYRRVTGYFLSLETFVKRVARKATSRSRRRPAVSVASLESRQHDVGVIKRRLLTLSERTAVCVYVSTCATFMAEKRKILLHWFIPNARHVLLF